MEPFEAVVEILGFSSFGELAAWSKLRDIA
jgi:hypothetical protein